MNLTAKTNDPVPSAARVKTSEGSKSSPTELSALVSCSRSCANVVSETGPAELEFKWNTGFCELCPRFASQFGRLNAPSSFLDHVPVRVFVLVRT